MRPRIAFVGSDLNARLRLEAVADVSVTSPAHPPEASETAVIDLDAAGADAVAELRAAGFDGRIVGFYSHVQEELGAAAAAAGAEIYPRGRFWRELATILGA
jgi:hypothetical protein